MIAYKHRFHGINALKGLHARGKTFRSPVMGLKVAPNDRRQDYRAAVVVSKKVSKSAVKRNRIRRRLYEAIRTYQPKFNQTYDLAIMVYNDSVADLPANELDKLVSRLMSDAGIIG